jgi:hypothetical protein
MRIITCTLLLCFYCLPARAVDLPQRLLPAWQALEQGDAGSLISFYQKLQPSLREPSLALLLKRYHQARIVPNVELLGWLRSLALQTPLLIKVSVEDGYSVSRPRYDYPALARAIIGLWLAQQRRDIYYQQLKSDSFNWRRVFRVDNSKLLAQQQDLIQALDRLSPIELARIYTHLDTRLYFPDNSLLAALAERLLSPKVLDDLWQRGVDQYSIEAARYVALQMPADRALNSLILASNNPEMAYYAYRGIAQLAMRSTKAAQFLASQGDEPQRKALVQRVMADVQGGDTLN